LLIALEPDNRAWLHERIGVRFAQMVQHGLLDEVRGLRARTDLHAALPALRCVGYRQAWAALDSGDFTHWQAQALAATRQLAKRQLTWLRSMPRRCRVACDGDDVGEQVMQRVRSAAADPSAPGPAARADESAVAGTKVIR
jgi:tRNA dimethylallyltransferase